MNLFVLDKSSKKSVRYHCDKHVVKLILEAVQMLYCAWHVLEDSNSAWKQSCPTPLKLTHKNHRINAWVRSNHATYDFTVDYAQNLLDEYTVRYNKQHSFVQHVKWLSMNKPSNLDKSKDLLLMPVAMPDAYKVSPMKDWDDIVNSYRSYYINEKLRFCSYKNVDWPDWLPSKSSLASTTTTSTITTPTTTTTSKTTVSPLTKKKATKLTTTKPTTSLKKTKKQSP